MRTGIAGYRRTAFGRVESLARMRRAEGAPVAHRGLALADTCAENDPRYPRALFHQALVTESAQALMQPNAKRQRVRMLTRSPCR